ncbi:MAG: ribosomal RNA small subunit methyltransferase A [Verrucomicrobia bacterium]|nr:ribosomal RNA small subunit methyltransferase A [Verrucomicrobiota bacterium]
MKLQEMRRILAANQLRLTKSLGQNFLHDQNRIRKIAKAAEIKADDRILEVGPGLGALTQLLLESGGKVLAIEKDRRLCDLLTERYRDVPSLNLVQADAVQYLRGQSRDWSGWKLVSNLPYSVASPILIELSQASGCPERLVATLQLEVARRLMASAGDEDYGVLTLLVQLRYEPKGWFRIPASCFFPVPRVDSACVTLAKRREILLTTGETDVFERIVKRGFSQRRKIMLKLLKEDWDESRLLWAYSRAGLGLEIRAEKVHLGQYVQLARLLRENTKAHHEG